MKEIDWNKEPVFMDNTLEKITRDIRRLAERYARQVSQGLAKNREMAWVLIHIEVQSSRETNFLGKFTFIDTGFRENTSGYFSLVILCDDEQNYRLTNYKRGIWGCELNFTFPIVKLLDFAENWAKMENDGNPFAIVVMAQLKAKEIKDDRQRKYWKFRLTRMLYERGYEKQDIIDLYCFIDWLLVLPEDLEEEFIRELYEFEKEKTMQYVSSIERIGFKKVEQQGLQHGMQQGESTMLFRLLERKFGQVSEEVKQKIEAADSDTLLEWGEKS